MKSSTHIIASGYIGVIAALGMNTEPKDTLIILAASAAGSIIPDIDKKGSKVSNKNIATGITSKFVRTFASHRGFTHTFLGSGIISLLLVYLISILPIEANKHIYMLIFIGLFFGMVSHILLDALNPKGVMLIWPLSRRRFNLMSIRTGTAGEFIFRIMLLIGLMLLVITFLTYRGFIN